MGLEPIPGPPLNLMAVGNGQKTRSTVRYKAPLVDTGGQKVEVAAYGMGHIMDLLEGVDPLLMRAVFLEAQTRGIEVASGKVDLLMGHDNLRLFPVEHRRVEDPALHRSRFGTGWIASGRPPSPGSLKSVKGIAASAGVTTSAESATRTSTVASLDKATNAEKAADTKEPAGDVRKDEPEGRLTEGTNRAGLLTSSSRVVPPIHIENGIFQLLDFLSAKALGTDMPRRCKNCLKCKECRFWADSLTFKENQEYQVILDGLKFDEKRRK
jgi:hypothetical protein